MIKEALQYLVELGNKKIQVGDKVYSTEPLHLVSDPTPSVIEVNSLSGLVDYVLSGFDGKKQFLIHVASPTHVFVHGALREDKARECYVKAQAIVPDFLFGKWYDPETFNIKLQSCFVPNEDRDIMLKVIGNIKEEHVNTYGDDGVSQAVTAKVGVATVAKVKVPNPVVLKPYRTFVEVDQPESNFVFRMRSGPECALFGADGGAWRLEAIKRIKEYLQKELQSMIDEGLVTIIA